MSFNIFYFGADKTWTELQTVGFSRRNTCIVKALAEVNVVNKVFLVRKTSISQFLKWVFSSRKNGIVVDVFFTSFIPGSFKKHASFKKLDQRLSTILLLRLCKTGKIGNNIIWCYWPSGYIAARDADINGIKIFDADHNIIDEPNVNESSRSDRKDFLLEIGNWADIILSSVRSMIQWYNNSNINKGVRLRNGVDFERFAKLSLQSKSQERIVIGYCGTLSRWLDYDLFEKLITRNPNWDFVIVGDPYLVEESLINKLRLHNVSFTGRKVASEIPEIMHTFTIGINLYKQNDALDVDSMKLYEYIGANVPVVSTPFHPWLEDDFEGLINIADDVYHFEEKILKIISGEIHYNQEKRISFLRKSSWIKRVSAFLDGLKDDKSYF